MDDTRNIHTGLICSVSETDNTLKSLYSLPRRPGPSRRQQSNCKRRNKTVSTEPWHARVCAMLMTWYYHATNTISAWNFLMVESGKNILFRTTGSGTTGFEDSPGKWSPRGLQIFWTSLFSQFSLTHALANQLKAKNTREDRLYRI